MKKISSDGHVLNRVASQVSCLRLLSLWSQIRHKFHLGSRQGFLT